MFDIGYDLGQSPVPFDERRLANSVRLFLRSGEINHETVEHYPGVHFWLLVGVYLLTYLRALTNGVVETFASVPLETFVVAGRFTSSILAVGTIILTGLLGRLVSDERTGLLAAGVVTFSPLAERVSTSLRNDETMVLLTLAAATASIGYYRSAWPGWSLAAGGLAGAAAAVKYSAVFSLTPAFVAIALRPAGGSRFRDVVLTIGGFAAVLATTNHYLWADVPNLIEQLSDEIRHLGPRHWGATDNPAWFYTSTIAAFGTGWPLLVLAMIGGVFALAGGRSAVWVLLAFPLSYWWFMARTPSQLPRWVYPLTPFVAVLGSMTMWTLRDWVARRWQGWSPASVRWLHALLTVTILVVTTTPILRVATILVSRRLTASTFERTTRWLQERATPDDVVLVEDGWLDLEDVAVQVRRVPRLGEVLAGGQYQLFANDWIVVPETRFGRLDVRRLTLVQEVYQDPGFNGNQGYDFRIYAAPKPVTVQVPMEFQLGTDAALPFLGLGWSREAQDDGLPFPQMGASLFLPPVGQDPFRIWLEVVPPDADVEDVPDVPVLATVDDVPTPMERAGDTGSGIWLVSGPVFAADVSSGITEVFVTRAEGAGALRLRTLAIR